MHNGIKIPYRVVVNKKLKHLYITITPEDGVIVKNPNFSNKEVQTILNKRAKWIHNKLLFLNSKNYILKIYEDEKKVLLFGKKELLEVKNLVEFYRLKSKEFIPSLVDKWAKITNLKPKDLKFRKSKKRWGSCSYDNIITFNISLVQLPLECIEYIILHELSHIKHKNHKKEFWLHVEKFLPNYLDYEKEIKNYSPNI